MYRFSFPWQSRRLSKLLLECEAAGAPTQRLLHSGKGLRSFLTYFGFWLVASYEQGQPWDVACVSADQMTSLAQALARLHSVQSRFPGPVFRNLPFWSESLDRSWRSEGLAAVNAAAVLDEVQKNEIKEWLHRSSSVFAGSSFYQLVHGDLWAKNLLVVNGTFVRLIDYEKASFSYAGFELADALIRFTRPPPFARRSTWRCPSWQGGVARAVILYGPEIGSRAGVVEVNLMVIISRLKKTK